MNVSGGRKVPRRKKIPDRERIGASGVNTGKTHSSKGGWKNEEPGNHNGGHHGVNDNDLCPAGACGRRQSAGAGLVGVPSGPGNGEPAGGLLRYRQGGEGLGRPACLCRGRRAELSHRGRHSVAVGCRNRCIVRGTTAGKGGTGGGGPPPAPFTPPARQTPASGGGGGKPVGVRVPTSPMAGQPRIRTPIQRVSSVRGTPTLR